MQNDHLIIADRYRVQRVLGEGGMARVYEAHDVILDRCVALKQLHTTYAEQPEAHGRFLREARMMAKLRHPNIAQIYDVGEDAGLPFFVQECIDGEALNRQLPLAVPEALSCAMQIADASAAIHSHGIVHCDLKPHNVIITPDGRAVLIDFGIALKAGTRTEQIFGTPHYVAPEVPQGAPPTPAADVYALGIVCYELLHGLLPPSEPDPGAVVREQARQGLPTLAHYPAQLTEGLATLLARMLDPDPTQRPPMAAVADELQRLQRPFGQVTTTIDAVTSRATVSIHNVRTQAVETVAPQPAPISTPAPASTAAPRRPLPRGPLMAVLAGCILLALLGVAILRRDDPQANVADGEPPASTASETAAPDAVPELEGPPLLEDGFESQQWPAGQQAAWALEYVEGRYHMRMAPGVGVLWSLRGNSLPAERVALAVDVEPQSGMAGVIFGFAGANSHYRFVTSADGAYRLERRAGGESQVLAEGGDAGPGRMAIVLDGATARLYSGTRQLAEVQLPAPPQGSYGLALAGPDAAEATFDNVRISELPAE